MVAPLGIFFLQIISCLFDLQNTLRCQTLARPINQIRQNLFSPADRNKMWKYFWRLLQSQQHLPPPVSVEELRRILNSVSSQTADETKFSIACKQFLPHRPTGRAYNLLRGNRNVPGNILRHSPSFWWPIKFQAPCCKPGFARYNGAHNTASDVSLNVAHRWSANLAYTRLYYSVVNSEQRLLCWAPSKRRHANLWRGHVHSTCLGVYLCPRIACYS